MQRVTPRSRYLGVVWGILVALATSTVATSCHFPGGAEGTPIAAFGGARHLTPYPGAYSPAPAVDMLFYNTPVSQITYLRSNTDGSWDGPFLVTSAYSSPNVTSLAVGDLNNDGRLDVVFNSAFDGPAGGIWWCEKTSTPGVWEPPVQVRAFPNILHVVTGDISDNGRTDIAFCTSDGVVGWIRSTSNAPTFGVNTKIIDTGVGYCRRLQLYDVNRDGQLDFVYANASSWGWYPWESGNNFAAHPTVVGVGFQYLEAFLLFEEHGITYAIAADWITGVKSLWSTYDNGTSAWQVDVIPDETETIQSVAMVDLDASGYRDLVFLTTNTRLMWQSRTGPREWSTLARPLLALTASYLPSSFVVHDFHGQGAPSAVIAHPAGIAEAHVVAQGPGIFNYSEPLTTTGVPTPAFIHLGDLNHDSVTDVAVAAPEATSILFLEGLGDGLSAPPQSVATGLFSPTHISPGDFNNDGLTDMSIAASLLAQPAIVANHGSGVFSTILVPFPVPNGQGILVQEFVDWNNDGWDDLVVANPGFLAILLNGGVSPIQDLAAASPTNFSVHVSLDTPPTVTPLGALIQDLTGDGALDILMWGHSTARMLIRGNGDGGLDAPVLWGTATRHMVTANLTLAAIPDLCWAAASQLQCMASQAPHDGITWSPFWTASAFFPNSILAVDLNQDGLLDLLVSASGFQAYYPGIAGPTHLAAVHEMVHRSSSLSAVPIAVADMDGDGDLDVVAGPDNTVSVARQSNTWRAWPRPARTITVDTAACGFRLACVARAISLHAGLCVSDTIVLPTGTYTGCFPRQLFRIRKSLTIVAQAPGVTIDCQGIGGLFHVTDGATVAVRGFEIHNAATAPWDVNGGSPVRVSGAGTTLSLDHVVVHGASPGVSIDGAATQSLPGMGGFALVADEASLVVRHSAFYGCHAAASGGVFAVTGTGTTLVVEDSRLEGNEAVVDGGAIVMDGGVATLTLTRTVCVDNKAATGHGGAIAAVTASHRISISDTVLSGNHAPFGAGGTLLHVLPEPTVLAQQAATGATAQLVATNVTVRDTHAVMGGAFAIVASPFPVAQGGALVSASVEPASSAPTVPFSHAHARFAKTTVTRASATYGGLLFACQAGVNFGDDCAYDEIHATAGGGIAFVCPMSNPTSWDPEVAIPWVNFVPPTWTHVQSLAASSQSTYGPLAASPPVAMLWVGETPALSAVPTGVPLGPDIAVRLEDAFGQQVIDSNVVVALALLGDPNALGVALGGAGVSQSATNPVLEIGTTATVAVAADASLPQTIPGATLTVEGQASVRPSLSLPPFDVTACPAGYGAINDPGSPLVCSACGPGTYSNATGSDPCLVACTDTDTVLIDGHCIACPELSIRDAAYQEPEMSVAPCVCLPGAWSREGVPDAACEPCPTGGICEGGLALPLAAPGYFPVAPGEMLRCTRPGACAGGTIGAACAPGYDDTSFMCSACEHGYYADSQGACSKCPTHHHLLFSVTVIAMLLLVVVVVTASVAFLSARSIRTTLSVREFRLRRVPYSIGMTIVTLQIVGILGDVDLGWPDSVRRAMVWSNVVNVNFQFFASQCTLGSFFATYAAMVMVPMLLAAACALALFLIHWCRPWLPFPVPDYNPRNLCLLVYFMLAPLCFIPTARSALTFFDCTRLPNGDWRLDADQTSSCFDGTWFGMLPLALLAALAYVVLPIASIAWVLLRHRHNIQAPDIRLRYGSLFQLYRTPYYYWELVALGKRLCLVVVALFFSTLILWMLLLQLTLFAAALIAQLLHTPFFQPAHNTLEARIWSALIAVMVLGTLFWADDFPNHASRVMVIILTFAVLATIVATLAFAIIAEMWRIHDEAARYQNGQPARPQRATQLRRVIHKEIDDLEDGVFQSSLLAAASTPAPESVAECGGVVEDVAMDLL